MGREENLIQGNVFRRIFLEFMDFFSQHPKFPEFYFNQSKTAEENVRQAISVSSKMSGIVSSDIELKYDIRIATLLCHLANPKYYSDFVNVTNIISLFPEITPERRKRIINMIKLVFKFTEVKTFPKKYNERLWMLYPHFAIRAENVGNIGVLKAYLYSIENKLPVTTKNTKLYDDIEDIKENVKPERYSRYIITKKSASFVDHLYDLTIHLSQIETKNTYFKNLFLEKRMEVIQFLLTCGKNKRVNLPFLYKLKSNFKF